MRIVRLDVWSFYGESLVKVISRSFWVLSQLDSGSFLHRQCGWHRESFCKHTQAVKTTSLGLQTSWRRTSREGTKIYQHDSIKSYKMLQRPIYHWFWAILSSLCKLATSMIQSMLCGELHKPTGQGNQTRKPMMRRAPAQEGPGSVSAAAPATSNSSCSAVSDCWGLLLFSFRWQLEQFMIIHTYSYIFIPVLLDYLECGRYIISYNII